MNLALANMMVNMMDDKNENVGYINFEFYRQKPCVNNIYKAFILCFLRFIPAYCKKCCMPWHLLPLILHIFITSVHVLQPFSGKLAIQYNIG